MNNRVIVEKREEVRKKKKVEKMDFFLVTEKGRAYLFTQEFSKGVYEYFRKGRSERELLSFRKWDKNPRLDKTIEIIPIYTKYVLKEVI